MRDEYNKDYRTREYDRFSDLEPQRERKKPSFLTLLLVGLLVLLVCSLGYDNIIKPYLEKSKEQTGLLDFPVLKIFSMPYILLMARHGF